MTPLRQRMLEDMQIRNLAPSTPRAYVEHVSRFARHFGRSPALLGPEDIRAYLSQRTREFGIRLALGATRGAVTGQLLKEGTATASVGVVGGLALAVALVQVLRQSGMLYAVDAVDPVVFAFAPLVLVAATTAASYVAARRALRVDPAVALRPE